MFDDISERIRYIRENKGLSVPKLVDKINTELQIKMKERTIYAYERAENSPSIDYLIILCELLNANLNWVVNKKGEPFNPAESTYKQRFKPNADKMRKIRKQINRCRIENDLMINEMSDLINITPDDYDAIIAGTKIPDTKTIYKVNENFDITLSELMCEND